MQRRQGVVAADFAIKPQQLRMQGLLEIRNRAQVVASVGITASIRMVLRLRKVEYVPPTLQGLDWKNSINSELIEWL